ncbi:TlpA family protein disulfide reductase [Tessaracoccus antarcticus]|uniref:TlpA family protein disulfide reductase n=1 Tax=Tessaracoccus antarcticus TaxID=2479848 RepID=A0A3M0GL60_9ACTN|nr:TlpA family protein disulfide reductase [Tessaracoccus antarcticus]
MLCLVSACSGTGGGTGPDGSVGFEGGDGSILVLPPDERQVAPELSGETLEGDPLSTADYAGKVMVLNVWGSWCAPCRAEAPALVAAAEQMPEVQFIGINTRDNDPAPAQAFVRAFGVEYPNLYDRDGSLLLGFGQVPPKAIPSTLVIDEQGRVAARILGELSTSTLVGVVEDVTAKK